VAPGPARRPASGDHSDYRQMGACGDFAVEQPHRKHRAPMVCRRWHPGVAAVAGQRDSMVWSLRGHAAALLALAPEALAQTVAQAAAATLGGLRVLTPAAAFPVALADAEVMVRPRLALVGMRHTWCIRWPGTGGTWDFTTPLAWRAC